ncbi:uncharacterized protein EDB93DRAFT_1254984 [Suillus bovinus]|uniref:uncharacterized protein n=1 Tax=Suillus bovinus TaxID=48563 RepID=UPI001B86429A|nr:uncharacterized protein EDB93DRAFT_1254984 [Suillus bovinus]KAG2133212.1 hypothetical protein EDB93DRAFT_1254984 [Suillus bovinus]
MSPTAAQLEDIHTPPQVFAPLYPFTNMTIYWLISWMNSGSSRVSESKVASLVKNVILAGDFDREDLQGFLMTESRPLSLSTFQQRGGRIVPGLIPFPGFITGLSLRLYAWHSLTLKQGHFIFCPSNVWKDPLDGHKEWIYDELYTSDAWLEAQDRSSRIAKVENTLGEGSWVPIMNQFVKKLGWLRLDSFHMLVVDIMHECELGTWKALFTHPVRLLYALPGGTQIVATLDTRFRQVLTFGNGVIHKFSNNTSEMKRLATCDFEDILQCAIPVFEGLFPPSHDAAIQSLLYSFAQWHTLAKLRVHSDSTLVFLDETFKKLCGSFGLIPALPSTWWNYQRRKQLNREGLQSARKLGELAHRALKAFYPLTSKLDTPVQLAKHECRCCVLRRVEEAGGTSPSIGLSPVEASSGKNHHIAISQNNPVAIFAFLRDHTDDTALKNFILKLKDHILYRLGKLDISYCDHTFTDEERNSVIIPNNTIYTVQTMQVHYTTYDMRWETSPNHPYWYACVLAIYHMETWLNNGGTPMKHHLDVLWVRWIAFVDELDTDAFGFLDPGQVIRGAHLIPAFNSGHGVSSLRGGKSFARPEGVLDDWEAYLVGIFVDQDMFMRYTHFGVGHPAMLHRIARDSFRNDSPSSITNAVNNSNIVVLEADIGYGEDNDSEGYEGCSNEGELSDEECSDEELEDEDEGKENESDDGCEEDGHKFKDEFNDLLSF